MRGGRGKATVVYLDSSMLVAPSRGSIDPHHVGATGACAAAWRSGYRVVTSMLAILEAVGAIRRRVTASHKRESGSEGERKEVDRAVRQAVTTLLNLAGSLEKQGRLAIVEMEGWSPDFAVLRTKMLEHAGHTVFHSKGNACRHRGLGLHDWLHIALARDADAAVICTADNAFADIVGKDDEFGHILVQMTGTGATGPLYDTVRQRGRGARGGRSWLEGPAENSRPGIAP